MIKFETVNRFENSEIDLIPTRKTEASAGYDMYVAEEIIIPPHKDLIYTLIKDCMIKDLLKSAFPGDIETINKNQINELAKSIENQPRTLEEMAKITKELKCKPTLVSTGVKCQLEPDTYLELSVRSSTPLKYWLILANSVGIIDADYYNNEDNEGEIFLQLINLSPIPIVLKPGDCIGQGIIKRYEKTTEDCATGTRKGGFGSTGA